LPRAHQKPAARETEGKGSAEEHSGSATREILGLCKKLCHVLRAEMVGEALHPLGGLFDEGCERPLVLLVEVLPCLTQSLGDGYEAVHSSLLLRFQS